ncbi:MAG: hypothetical protein IK104_09255, partial [Clostridia bacterium]|nr:hypothetical protein [Clostridia bacterium]
MCYLHHTRFAPALQGQTKRILALCRHKKASRQAPSLRDLHGSSPLFSARTARPAGDIRQDDPLPFRLFEQKIAGEKLLRTAADAIFVKDKAQGSDNPDGYPTPATQYFANKCAAA